MSEYDITLQEAIDYTTAWRGEHGSLIKAFKIDKAEIDEIFAADESAVGIRAYLGLDGSAPKLVLVGVDSEGKDILTKICDHCAPCPDACDSTSVLNNGE